MKDIKKNQLMDIPSNDNLSETDNQLCVKIVKDFHNSKAQKPTGVLDKDSGEFKHYFVWAGGTKKEVPDATEPGKYLIILKFDLISWRLLCNLF